MKHTKLIMAAAIMSAIAAPPATAQPAPGTHCAPKKRKSQDQKGAPCAPKKRSLPAEKPPENTG